MTIPKRYLLFRFTFVLLLGATSPVIGATQPPLLRDEAMVLSSTESNAIVELLSTHNARGPGRVWVLIVPQLPAGESIESFTRQQINQPRRPASEKNDRVLLSIAIKDRKLRIETSPAVWSLLTDDICKRIIDTDIVPKFKEQEYFEGIRDGVKAIVARLES